MRKEGKMRIRMGYEMVMGYDVDMGCYFLERFSEYGEGMLVGEGS